MQTALDEAIEELKEDIQELQERKAFLEQLDTTKIPTEDEWHEMCLSPLRSSDILAVFLKNIFPNATDIKVGCNYVIFYLYNIKCYLPTSAIRGIEIDIDWFSKLQKPSIDDYDYKTHRLIMLEKYMKSDNWNDKSKIILGGYKKWYRFLLWNLKYKFKDKQYKSEYEYLTNNHIEKTDKRLKQYELNLYTQKEIINTIKNKVIPELNNFTTNISIHSDNYFGSVKNMDELLTYYDNV